MGDHGAPLESNAVSLGGSFPLPDADTIAAAWSERPSDVAPVQPDKAKTISAAMLVLGVALLLFVPVGGALLLVSGGLGLAISWDDATAASQPSDGVLHRPLKTASAVTTTSTGLSSMVGRGRRLGRRTAGSDEGSATR
jgi:hypothetical protein